MSPQFDKLWEKAPNFREILKCNSCSNCNNFNDDYCWCNTYEFYVNQAEGFICDEWEER
jgi:hypothetical protein